MLNPEAMPFAFKGFTTSHIHFIVKFHPLQKHTLLIGLSRKY